MLEHTTDICLIDTNEKPFRCPCCDRSFRRADVRKLHLETCHAEDAWGQGDLDAYGGGTSRKRIRVACDHCRRRKIRCSGREPCQSCQESGLQCFFSESTRDAHQATPLWPVTATAESAFCGSQEHTVDPSPSSDSNSVFQVEQMSTSTEPCTQSGLWVAENRSLALPAGTQPAYLALPRTQPCEPCQSIERPSVGGVLGDSGLFAQDAMAMWFGTGFDADGYCPAVSQTSISGAFMDRSDPFELIEGPFLGLLGTMPQPPQELVNTCHDLPPDFPLLSSMIRRYFNHHSRTSSPSEADETSGKLYYSDPPNLAIYDAQVLKIFLNLFWRHIPPSFPIFEDLCLGRHPDAHYVLALAAVGGLFCSVEGSLKMAMAMYNDSRRLVLRKVVVQSSFNCSTSVDELSNDPSEWLVVVKTFILLELYGYCSGDRRTHEFAEAYHGHLLEAAQHYALSKKETAYTKVDIRLVLHFLLVKHGWIFTLTPAYLRH
ncbi:hypothetical protein NA57DRAFT_52505 [Rhizodiscina lignyota]|uniref:Zn(2)-C6 fungal-type domain-containing protein n=1 Tax=Rhizodiscina lignyota TaxID=1504668 RepID=A0A9P4IJY1_9PEZI|nr:hypothetical protein NA57DRAFT_52505 [Rhizodiscina lignyota]